MSEDISSGNTLSDRQEMLLSLMYVVSSVLSILGSSTIVYKVLSNPKKATSYDRLMLGLSSCDIVASIGYSLYPFLGPRDNRLWAIGSQASCNFVGFLTQVGFAAIFYNGFLSYYYLFTIRYGMSREYFARVLEPWAHAFAWIFSLTTATVGAALGFFSEVQVGMGCWVNDYPRGCVDDCLSEELGWIYGGTPIFFALFALVTNNILIYLHVRKIFAFNENLDVAHQARQRLQKREVAIQGFLYVASWFFCFWSAIAVRITEAFSYTDVDETKIYWMLLFQGATLPLQGFLNMFVYNLPNYRRIRKAVPGITVWKAIQKACLDSEIPKLAQLTQSGGSRPKSNQFPKYSSGQPKISISLKQIPEGSNEDRESFSSESEGLHDDAFLAKDIPTSEASPTIESASNRSEGVSESARPRRIDMDGSFSEA